MSAACRSCGAPIIWAVSASGKRMPVNAQPEKRIVLLRTTDEARPPLAELYDTYTSHFSTCPDADKHRKKARE